MFTFLPKEWDFVLGKSAHAQHAFTQGQCCVSAILDPLLQFWTSEWCRGEPKWRWVFSLPVSQHAWRRVLVRRQAADGEVRCDVG